MNGFAEKTATRPGMAGKVAKWEGRQVPSDCRAAVVPDHVSCNVGEEAVAPRKSKNDAGDGQSLHTLFR